MSSAALLSFMWLTFLGMVVLEVRRRSPALLFVGGAILSAGLPISFMLFGNRFEPALVREAILYISAFNALYFLTRFVLRGSKVIPSRVRYDARPLSGSARRLLSAATILFVLPFALKFAEVGFSLAALGSMTWRDSGGIFSLLATYFAHASFGLVLCLFYLRRYRLSMFALLAVVFLVFVDRSRALGIAAIAPLLLFLVFWSIEERVSPLRIASTAGLTLLALLAFFLVQQVRYLGPLMAVATADPQLVFEAAWQRLTSLEADLALVEGFIWMMRNGSQVEGFGEGVTLQRMLIFWLPGGWKPPEFTHSIASAMHGGLAGASVHPTIYGLTWGEARWLGLSYAILTASILRVLDRIMIGYRGDISWSLLAGPYSVFALLAARGSLYNGWVGMIAALTVLLGLIHVTDLRRRQPWRCGEDWTVSGA